MNLLQLIEATRDLDPAQVVGCPFLVPLGEKGEAHLKDFVTQPLIGVRRRDQATGDVTFGRSHQADVIVPVMGISQLHAFFRQVSATRWQVIDNASTNGTFVSGWRLGAGERADLGEGTVLRFGPKRFCFGSLGLYKLVRQVVLGKRNRHVFVAGCARRAAS
ncbi:MAG TPA: FHA domain-containing protein [Planctomycetota bacterium]|nr:FHA domain-containing protein [Planctomycetota bacterium]